MKKKGQASFEYLTTYGWALLALGIAFTALYLFMDFKPDRLVPDSCSFGGEFDCREFKIDHTNGRVNLSLINVVGTTINLDSLVCEYQGMSFYEKVDAEVKEIAPGAPFSMACNVSGESVALKKKSKIDITIVYYKSGDVFPLSSDGFISATIIK